MWFRKKKMKLADIARPLSLVDAKKKARILVIDDDPNSFPVDLLKKEGYAIDSWEHVESLEKLEEGKFDIIVLDISGVAEDYCEDDGLGILRHLKKYNPAQIIVAYSGQSFDLGKHEFFKLADDSLTKPVDAVKCKEVIDALLLEKYTVEHYWEGLRQILMASDLPSKRLDEIEHELAEAFNKKDSCRVQEILKSLGAHADSAGKILSIGTKLIALLGG